MGVTIYVRYRQIQEIGLRHTDVQRAVERLNGRSFWVGMGSCLGVSMVGNFQETNVRIMHYVGAFLAFGLGTVYYWMQVRIVRLQIVNRRLLTYRHRLSSTIQRFFLSKLFFHL